jgi:hypothetical protein
MKKTFASLRLLFLLASMLFTALSFMPSGSEASKCDAFCGAQGPISCNYPCRRPD